MNSIQISAIETKGAPRIMTEPKRTDEDQVVSVRLEPGDLADLRRILRKIAHAADRRSVLHGAREIKADTTSSIEGSAQETLALQMFAASEARDRLLPRQVNDCAWDILLTAYLAEKAGARHTIGRFVERSQCSPTATLRRIDLLEQEGLVKRERDPQDRRILHLLLSEPGRESVEQVLSFALERHAL